MTTPTRPLRRRLSAPIAIIALAGLALASPMTATAATSSLPDGGLDPASLRATNRAVKPLTGGAGRSSVAAPRINPGRYIVELAEAPVTTYAGGIGRASCRERVFGYV